MTDQTDLTVPLSSLQFDGDSSARAMPDDWNMIQTGAVLQHVIHRHAEAVLDAGEPVIVSVTFDVSAETSTGTEIVFESRIDRKTRTLVFASGIAAQGSRHLLKSTVVFRIG